MDVLDCTDALIVAHMGVSRAAHMYARSSNTMIPHARRMRLPRGQHDARARAPWLLALQPAWRWIGLDMRCHARRRKSTTS